MVRLMSIDLPLGFFRPLRLTWLTLCPSKSHTGDALEREAAAAAAHASAVATAARAATAAAVAAAAAPPFMQDECAYCAQLFDEGERAPRLLACGHMFCTACVGARTRKTGARKWRFTCPVDGDETPVKRNNATTLKLCTVLMLNEAPLFRLHLKNLAGDMVSLIVSATWTVGSVKRALCDANDMYVVYRQRLMLQGADNEYTALEDDAVMLGALGIRRERVVTVMVQDPFSGGEYVRTIRKDDDEHSGGWWNSRFMCASPCGQFLFFCEREDDRVIVLRLSDGAHVRTLGPSTVDVDGDDQDAAAAANDDDDDDGGDVVVGGVQFLAQPFCIRLSRDGSLLFLALAYSVAIVRVADGSHVRTFRVSDNVLCGMCVSFDDQYVYTTHANANRIQVWRVADGSHAHTLNLAFEPGSLVRSADGELLFVLTADQRIAVVRAADGAHTRSITISLPDPDTESEHGCNICVPSDLCTSRDGKLLFVSDYGLNRVHVLCASDGTLVRSFGERGAGDGQLTMPTRVCLSASGDSLFVADGIGCDRIQVFTGN